MSLTEQVVDVPLMPLNEQALALSGPVGRIKSMSNMVARKVTGTQAGTRMRLEKRPGSTLLAPAANLVTTGAAGTAPANVTMAATLGDQLVEVGGGIPYTYSAGASIFEQYGTRPLVDTRVFQRKSIANTNAVLYAPDVAAVGNVLMYTFISRDPTTSTRTGYATIVDGKGVQIRSPFIIGGEFRCKVVSDGLRFWVFTQTSARTSTVVQVFDTTGTQLATTTLNWGGAVFSWDAHWDAAVGVWLATPVTTTNLSLVKLTYAAGVISLPVNVTLSLDLTNGCGFLENTQGDAHTYLAGVDTTFHVSAYQFTTAGAAAHTYIVDNTNSVYLGNVTGYVKNGSFDIVVTYCIIQNTPPLSASFVARNNQTKVAQVTFAGSTTALYTQRSLSLASRAFKDGVGNWSVIAYYQSSGCFSSVGTTVGPADVSQIGAQPTYFVMSLTGLSALGGSPITGQFETGFAYQFMQSRNSLDLYPFHLSSCAVEFQSTTAVAGAQHIPLSYLGEQQSLGVTISAVPYTVFVALAGIRDYVIMPYPGTAVSTSNALLLPGMRATRFDTDTFVEDGFALAPEIVSVTLAGGGNLTNGEQYSWVCVYEYLDGNGEVVESATSQPIVATPGVASQQATLVIATDRTTSKKGVRISVYSTFSPNLTTTAGVELRKVGEVLNDPTVDTVSFVDQSTDASKQLGQELYSQFLNLNAAPALDYFAAPAFRQGCFFEDRAFVVGYDNSVWFSEEKVDGHALTWNPELRVLLPTTDTVLSVQPMDTRIVILCDKSVWAIDGGNLPNATLTAGAIPTPQQFPLPTGALGPGFSTPLGLLYAAQSGIWALDRSLQPNYIGAAVQDETGANIAQITSATVDKAQRVYFTMSTQGNVVASESLPEMVVYDLITGVWYVWTMGNPMLLSTTWQGTLSLVDSVGQTWTLDDANTSSYTDNNASIPSRFMIAPVVLASVNGYQAVWQVQFYGLWKGAHTVTVGVQYDGSSTTTEQFPQVVNSNPGVYRYEFLPSNTDCQEIGFTFSDGSPVGNSFAIETLSLLVGVEQGLGRLPPATNRIAPA